MADLEWEDENPIVEQTSSFKHLNQQPLMENFDFQNQVVYGEAENINSWELPESTGQTVGGIGGGYFGMRAGLKVAANLHPVTRTLSTVLSGMAGAGTAGAAGDLTQQAFYSLTDSPKAPDNWTQAINHAVSAGAEEMVYELIGQTAATGIGVAYRKLIKGKAMLPGMAGEGQDIQKIFKEAELGEISVVEMIRQLVDASGGRLTAAQVVNGNFIKTIESLSEAAWGGTAYRGARELTDESIQKLADDYITNFNNTAGKTLSAEELGDLFKNAISVGIRQHHRVGGILYDELDEAYKPFMDEVERTVTHKSAWGGKYDRVEVFKEEVEILPVSLKNLKNYVQKIIDQGKPVQGLTVGDEAVLKKILASDEKISFSVAQDLRTTFLAESRSMEQAFGKDNAKRIANDIQDIILKSMDDGALATKNDEFIKKYRSVSKFWKTGVEGMMNKNMSKLILQDPEKIGNQIFASGNVTRVREARHALRWAEQFSKGTDEAIDFTKTWNQMQSGYLEEILGGARKAGETVLESGVKQTGKDVVASEFTLANLNKLFIKGTPANKTFNEAFTAKQRNSLRFFTNAIDVAQKRVIGQGDFMIKVGQAGLILDATGALNPWIGEGVPEITSYGGDLAIYALSPYLISRMLTSPRNVRLLTRGLNMKWGDTRANAVFAQIMKEAGKYFELSPIEFTQNDTVQLYYDKDGNVIEQDKENL